MEELGLIDDTICSSDDSDAESSTHQMTDSPSQKRGFLYLDKSNDSSHNNTIDGLTTLVSPLAWKQTWFVLDKHTGILTHGKFTDPQKSSPLRASAPHTSASAHNEFNMKLAGTSLFIQGEASHDTPTPFCFTLGASTFEEEDATLTTSSSSSPGMMTRQYKTMHLCAETQEEFKSWMDSLSSQIETDTTQASTVRANRMMPKRRALNPRMLSSPPPLSWRDLFIVKEGSLGYGVLLMLNPIAVIYVLGDWQVFALLQLILNVFFIWLLWFYHDTPSPMTLATSSASLSAILSEVEIRRDVSAPFTSSSLPDTSSFRPSYHKRPTLGPKPAAGATVLQCESTASNTALNSWSTLDAVRFNVRAGPNYRKTKLKKPSQPSLLDIIAIDVFASNMKIDDIGSCVTLPGQEQDTKDLFIVNCQVPGYIPSNPLWGEKQGDGPGFNLVMYFSIRPEIRQQLDTTSTNPAVNLLRNFMKEDSTVRDRFKAIGIVSNPEEQTLLGRTERHLLDSYNGQPILTRPQHRFYNGAGYFEVDVDAHQFAYVARKGLSGVTDHMCHMIVDFGFVIEGQKDDELPEQVLACVRLCKLDLENAEVLN